MPFLFFFFQCLFSEGRRLKRECEGWEVGEVGVENVCEGGQRGTNDLAGCIHCVLQGLSTS